MRPGSGKSGKIQIIQGELSSAASLYQLQGAQAVYATDPSIKIVSDQAANWDATKAHDITATVLQQNPDLCAIHGFWDVMSLGAHEAVKQAGMDGKVIIDVSGDGARAACDGVQSGAFSSYFSYDAQQQGRDLISMAKVLLESHQPPGSQYYALYSPLTILTKDTMKPSQCFDVAIKK